jgi:hypothetical protein
VIVGRRKTALRGQGHVLHSDICGASWRVFMRSKLIALVVGLCLAAIVGPALACNYGTSAENSKTTSQETAQSQPVTDTGSN